MIGKTISHYKIVEKLGEGGMGVVYKAEDTKLKRIVALKFFNPQMLGTEEDKTRFMLEAQAAARLEHPNICTVHEIDEADDQTFIAMAYVDGQSLEEKVESGVLETGEALDIALQVAEGLKEAHTKGIIHRDIKAANIMVSADGQVKIMDFGLAKLAGRSRLTKTATIMGTVAYMSPEQANGDSAIDHRTDIWSLGVVLYKMLTGNPPFDAPSDAALIHKIIYEQMKPASSLRSDIPPAVEDIIQKTLKKNPQERYQDMQSLIADLKSARTRMVAVETKTSPSIAVLPFVNMSADPEQEYFCDGLSEELINGLTQIEDLKVIARTSAFSFKNREVDIQEIGRRLKVRTVLEGSVRKSGNRLRITAQLIGVSDGYHLWSERYDRELDDIFAIQDEITQAIIAKLKPRLVGEEKGRPAKRQAVDLEAYNLYLEGRWFLSQYRGESIAKAIERFEQAIKKDPDYVPAYASLAASYAMLGIYGATEPKEVLLKAKEAALKALAIDENHSKTQFALAMVKTYLEWDWQGAERASRRAIEIDPGDAEVHHYHALQLMYMARFDEAMDELEKARELDPLSLLINRNIGTIFLYARRYDQAIKQCKRVIEMNQNFPLTHTVLAMSYLGKGMYEDALAEFKKEAVISGMGPLVEALGTGCAHALMENSEEAQLSLDRSIELSKQIYVPPYWIARMCFCTGNEDRGFDFLNKAYEAHDIWLCYVKIDLIFDNVTTDPRYKAILQKIGLDK